MKIVFVNRFFSPDHSATSQLLSDLAFYLVQQDFIVHVVTCRQRYDDPEARLPSFEQVSGVQVHRVWTSRFGRGRLIGRGFDYLTFYLCAFIKLVWLLKRGDVVVAKTDPPMISVVVGWSARIKGARLVNWLQDVFPEVAVELGVKVLGGRFGAWLHRFRDSSLRAASMNVVIGERMADKVRGCGVDADKVRVIPNWADGTDIVPLHARENALRGQWGLEGKFVVGYSGNMGRAHDFDTMLRSAELLRANKAICFLFIGAGKQLVHIQNEVIRLGLDNVVFQPYQPREMLTQSLGVSDIHVVSLLPQLEGLIMPSKLYGIMAAGRPTIFVGAKDGELARMLETEGCGICVEVGNAADFANVVFALSREPDKSYAMGVQARRVFDSRFGKQISLALWREAIFEAG